MKAILLNRKPKEIMNILNGLQKVIIMKNIPRNFQGWVYLYCRKGKQYVFWRDNSDYDKAIAAKCVLIDKYSKKYEEDIFNNKVVARFWLDELSFFTTCNFDCIKNAPIAVPIESILNKTCMTKQELANYESSNWGEGEKILFGLYALHIKNLQIFDKPMELSEFYKLDKKWEKHYKVWNRIDAEELDRFKLSRAPQSWQYVEVVE